MPWGCDHYKNINLRAARLIRKSRGSTIGYAIDLVMQGAEFGFFFSWWYVGFELTTGSGSGDFNKEREWNFMFLWDWGMRDSQGEGGRILTCLINWPTPTRNLAWLARFQVKNSHSSVTCQVLSNVAIIVWLHMLVSCNRVNEVFESYCHHFCWLNEICWFPIFSNPPTVSWPPDPFKL